MDNERKKNNDGKKIVILLLFLLWAWLFFKEKEPKVDLQVNKGKGPNSLIDDEVNGHSGGSSSDVDSSNSGLSETERLKSIFLKNGTKNLIFGNNNDFSFILSMIKQVASFSEKNSSSVSFASNINLDSYEGLSKRFSDFFYEFKFYQYNGEPYSGYTSIPFFVKESGNVRLDGLSPNTGSSYVYFDEKNNFVGFYGVAGDGENWKLRFYYVFPDSVSYNRYHSMFSSVFPKAVLDSLFMR